MRLLAKGLSKRAKIEGLVVAEFVLNDFKPRVTARELKDLHGVSLKPSEIERIWEDVTGLDAKRLRGWSARRFMRELVWVSPKRADLIASLLKVYDKILLSKLTRR